MSTGQGTYRSLLSDDWYVNPLILDREIATAFRNAWHYVGRQEQVRAAGDFFTATIAHVPIVVVRNSESSIVAHVNVCAHRGHEVACGEGNCDTFRCPYHGWTYALSGSLSAARHISLAEMSHSLTPAHLVQWGPMLFVSVARQPLPFSEWVGDIPAMLASNRVELDELEFERHIPWTFEANWKVGIENFLECYHCPVVHPMLSKALDVRPSTYRLIESKWSSTQLAPAGSKSSEFIGDGAGPAAQFHYLWPSTTLTVNPGPGNLWVNAWHPDGPHRTTGFGDIFFSRGVDRESREKMMDYNAVVSLEDDSIVQSVQRGLRSRALPFALLAAEEESLIRHFQKLVVREVKPD